MPTFIFLPSLISTFYCGFLPEKMLMDGLGLFNMVSTDVIQVKLNKTFKSRLKLQLFRKFSSLSQATDLQFFVCFYFSTLNSTSNNQGFRS